MNERGSVGHVDKDLDVVAHRSGFTDPPKVPAWNLVLVDGIFVSRKHIDRPMQPIWGDITILFADVALCDFQRVLHREFGLEGAAHRRWIEDLGAVGALV